MARRIIFEDKFDRASSLVVDGWVEGNEQKTEYRDENLGKTVGRSEIQVRDQKLAFDYFGHTEYSGIYGSLLKRPYVARDLGQDLRSDRTTVSFDIVPPFDGKIGMFVGLMSKANGFMQRPDKPDAGSYDFGMVPVNAIGVALNQSGRIYENSESLYNNSEIWLVKYENGVRKDIEILKSNVQFYPGKTYKVEFSLDPDGALKVRVVGDTGSDGTTATFEPVGFPLDQLVINGDITLWDEHYFYYYGGSKKSVLIDNVKVETDLEVVPKPSPNSDGIIELPLPFNSGGKPVKLTQGPGDAPTHVGKYTKDSYAHDFDLDMGHELLAIANGRILYFKDGFENSCKYKDKGCKDKDKDGKGKLWIDPADTSKFGNYVTLVVNENISDQEYYITYMHLLKGSVTKYIKERGGDKYKDAGSIKNSYATGNEYALKDVNELRVSVGDVVGEVGASGYFISSKGDGSHLHIQFGNELHKGYAYNLKNFVVKFNGEIAAVLILADKVW